MRTFIALIACMAIPVSALAECDSPDPWELKTTDATGKDFVLDEAFPDRVTVMFYEGQGHMKLNDDVKDRFKLDDGIGTGGHLLDYVDYVGIANYKEIAAPDFLVKKYLKKRIKKFKVPVLDDRDLCFAGSGKSKKCKSGERQELFESEQANFVVLYDKSPVLRLTGRLDGDTLIPHVREIVEAASEDKSLCWVLENLEY